ncbi:ISAs1 family transposase [Capnocytophaga canimorsus]|uniref:ISAs1 family transposase n=1 Tax=Capnocytophaga canimorsus TaxID=28188 RepID=UPI001E430C14|nr:ISAs1 family transposase [Capnocytophaga canimorsus]
MSENELCIGQKKVADKSNEITAIPEIINSLDIENSVVSIDAMGCQKEIASLIMAKKGHYFLSLKSVLLDENLSVWAGLKTLIQIESERYLGADIQKKMRYYISSEEGLSADYFNELVRGNEDSKPPTIQIT